MKKQNFKVGDFAIVIDEFTGHCFEPGEIVEIILIEDDIWDMHTEYKISTSDDYWWCNGKELFKIEL